MPTRDADIHVLHVVPMLGEGGMEQVLCRVANALLGEGMRHSVISLKGPAEAARFLDPAIQVVPLQSRPNDPLLPLTLGKLIRQMRPDVVQAYNWGAWPDTAAARLLSLPWPPLVFAFHGMNSSGLPPRRQRIAFTVLSRMTTCLLTVSAASRDFLVRQLGLPDDRIHVIPNGVDCRRFAPADRPANARLVIATVGNLTAVKNQALLVRAFARAIGNGMDARLRIAGKGPLRESLADLAQSLGVADRVELCGFVDDVPGFLRQADLFALSSSTEQHPLGLLEAMACGLPAVATNVGGVEEVLQSGRCGLIVPSQDEPALANALRTLSSDAPLRAELSARARQRVLEAYDLPIMIQAYGRLYRRLANRQAWAVSGD